MDFRDKLRRMVAKIEEDMQENGFVPDRRYEQLVEMVYDEIEQAEGRGFNDGFDAGRGKVN